MSISPNHSSRCSSSPRATINRDLRRPAWESRRQRAGASCARRNAGEQCANEVVCSTWPNFRNTLITNIGRVRSLPRTQVFACVSLRCGRASWLRLRVCPIPVCDRDTPVSRSSLVTVSLPSTATTPTSCWIVHSLDWRVASASQAVSMMRKRAVSRGQRRSQLSSPWKKKRKKQKKKNREKRGRKSK